MCFGYILEHEFGSSRVFDKQFHGAIGEVFPRASVGSRFRSFFGLKNLWLSLWFHFYVDIIQIMSNQREQPNKQNDILEDKNNLPKDSLSDSNSASRSSSSSNSRSGERNSDSKQKEEVQVGGEGDDKKVVRYKYCCKICKHPDKSKRACVCVVPLSQRRADLGTGCRNCGCTGCSKQDFISKGEDPEYHPEEKQKNPIKNRKPEAPKREEKRSQRRRQRSNSRKRNKSPRRKVSRLSSSRSRSPQYIDSASMKFYNFDRSLIGSMIMNQYQLNPIMLGFGVPQRTFSYVFGRPK